MKTCFTLFCSFALSFVSTIACGQKTLISVGGNVVAPTAFGIKRVAGTGFGGSLRLETSFGKHTYGMATVEYLKFAEKTSFQQTTKFTAVPIQIGIKYYAATKEEKVAKGLFVSGEVGIMPSTTHFTYTSGNKDKFKESGLSVAPGLGYQLGRVEASFRPQFNLSASGFNVYYLNFRLAYTILKKKNRT
ncbi:MAG: hypothetical protein ICV53_06645 [Flavisolibacter sp.]|nr:hypothetical protein [Flavisolibacter sp.]